MSSKKFPFIFLLLIIFTLAHPIEGQEKNPKIDYTKIITKIKIKGIQHTPKKALPSIFSFQNKPHEKVIKRFIDADLKQLYQTGYFSKVYASTTESESESESEFILTYHTIEHPIIHKIKFIGNDSISSRKLIKQLKSKVNRPLNLNAIQHDKQNLDTYYQKKGYDLFRIVTIQFKKNTLVITLNEAHISKIQIDGLSQINPNILTRQLEIQAETPFNTFSLRRDRERLLRLGYFSSVSAPKLQQDLNSNTLIVTFKVKEKKANRIEIGIEQDGIGQETDQTVGFIKGIKNHLFIQSDSFSGKIQISNAADLQKFNNYRINYHQPWIFNRLNIAWSTDIWKEITQEIASNQATNQSRTIESTLRKGQMITLEFPLKHDMLVLRTKGKHEKITPQNNNTISPYSLNSGTAELSYYSITSPFNPKQGSYWSIQYERGGRFGTINTPGIKFSRTTMDTAKFIPIGKKGTIGLHANFGIFRSEEDSQTTFETENFIIGGTYSLRGYNENNFPFSGARKVLFNIEYRHDLFKKIQGILFYDMGNTFDTGFNIDLDTLHKGYGFGIRYFTPVGPIRLDFAQGETDYRIHFGLGQLF